MVFLLKPVPTTFSCSSTLCGFPWGPGLLHSGLAHPVFPFKEHSGFLPRVSSIFCPHVYTCLLHVFPSSLGGAGAPCFFVVSTSTCLLYRPLSMGSFSHPQSHCLQWIWNILNFLNWEELSIACVLTSIFLYSCLSGSFLGKHPAFYRVISMPSCSIPPLGPPLHWNHLNPGDCQIGWAFSSSCLSWQWCDVWYCPPETSCPLKALFLILFWSCHCGLACRASIYDASIPHGIQFLSWLFHFYPAPC